MFTLYCRNFLLKKNLLYAVKYVELLHPYLSISLKVLEDFLQKKTRFIEISFGSLTEISCELEISFELGYITKEEYEEAEKQIIIISKQLSNLHKSVSQNFSKINDPQN